MIIYYPKKNIKMKKMKKTIMRQRVDIKVGKKVVLNIKQGKNQLTKLKKKKKIIVKIIKIIVKIKFFILT